MAYQELLELTQRKFLKQLTEFCAKMKVIRPLPRLFCIDYVDRLVVQARKTLLLEKSVAHVQNESLIQCIRPMCEYDEGWHVSDTFMVVQGSIAPFGSYLARVMNIIKRGSLASELTLFQTAEGQQLLSEIEGKALAKSETDLSASYAALRAQYASEFEKDLICTTSKLVSLEKEAMYDLKLCELKNGKVLWLCAKHMQASSAREIRDSKVVDAISTEISRKFLLKINENKSANKST